MTADGAAALSELVRAEVGALSTATAAATVVPPRRPRSALPGHSIVLLPRLQSPQLLR